MWREVSEEKAISLKAVLKKRADMLAGIVNNQVTNGGGGRQRNWCV